MAKPNLTFTIEPLSGGKLFYLRQAPSFNGGTARAKIIVKLRITNHAATKVQVDGIAFHFPGTTRPKITMEGEKQAIIPDGLGMGVSLVDNDGWIGAGVTATWYNGTVNLTEAENSPQALNQTYLTGKVPKTMSIHVHCTGFSQSVTQDVELIPFTEATDQGAFLFPFSTADLKSGEYFVTRGQHWANGFGTGLQIYAHDIDLQGIDSGVLSVLKKGKSKGKVNADFRIWGVPVRAMADGTVEESFDTTLDNDDPTKFPPAPAPQANYVIVKHGDIYAYYAHFKQGSIPAALKKIPGKPAPFVRAGEMLGLAGNSGHAQGPHLHIECSFGGGTIRPLAFRKAWILDIAENNPPKINDPWVQLNAEGVPKEEVAIWPESTWPGSKVPTAGLSVPGNWNYRIWKSNDFKAFKAKVQEYFDDGYPLTYFSSFLDNGHRRWVGIFRTGTQGITFWQSADWKSFSKKADNEHDIKKKRLVHAHAFKEGDKVRWVGLTHTANWANRFWLSDGFDAFKTKVKELAGKDKLTLVHASNMVIDGKRWWLGIARGGTGWTTELFFDTSLEDFKSSLEKYKKAGKECIHMFPYFKDDDHRWVGIVRKKEEAVDMWQNSNFDSFWEVIRHAQHKQGRRLIALEFPE